MKRQLSNTPQAAYARGYNAGIRKLSYLREEWRKAVERIRMRMARAELSAGIGQCQGCVFWSRERNCSWGYCNAAEASSGPMWPMPWAYVVRETDYRNPDRFCTQETFGCINFHPSAQRTQISPGSASPSPIDATNSEGAP